MHRYSLSIATLICVSVLLATHELPNVASAADASVQAHPGPIPESAAVSLHFVRFGSDFLGKTAELELRNTGASEFTYYGDSPLSPAYSRELMADGGWQAADIARCGNGMGPHVFAPGTTVRFSASLESGAAVARIGLLLRDVADQQLYKIWSPPITPEQGR